MNAIIVENDQFAADNLKYQLDMIKSEIRIKSIDKSVQEALFSIAKFNPELVFLDIELDGEKNGIELLKEIENINFKIIFTTSFNEYAVSAFKVNAIDYLIKPYSTEELSNALKKLAITKSGEQSILNQVLHNSSQHSDMAKLAVRNSKGDIIIMDYNEIVYLEAEGSTVFIFTKDKKYCNTTASLNDFALQLSPYNFVRIHQKYIINSDFLNKISKPNKNKNNYSMGAGGQVELKNGLKFPISRIYLQELKSLFRF